MAYDRAVEVWGASGVSRKVRKVSLCKPCYRTWKKEKKGEPKEWVSKGKGALGNAPPHFHASQKFRSAVRILSSGVHNSGQILARAPHSEGDGL